MKLIKLLALAAFISFRAFAQTDNSQTATTIPLLSANFAVEVPGGDMANQFGTCFTIGASFLIKTPKNILLGVEGNLIFGGHVKNQDRILAGISTHEGFVIAQSGYYADILYEARGFSAFITSGKIFPVVGPNANSGLFFTIGPGYLQHRIKIDNTENIAPQVYGDYKKGYDKLMGGFALSENIGYLNISNRRVLNFKASLEFIQAWTKALRSYDFNLRGKDTSNYFDLLYGIRLGWMIPLNKRNTEQYYYY